MDFRQINAGLSSRNADKAQTGKIFKATRSAIPNQALHLVHSGREGSSPSVIYNEKSQEGAIAIATNEGAWLDALKPVFGHVIAIGKVFDPTSLAALMYQYYAPTFPSPAWWFQPSP